MRTSGFSETGRKITINGSDTARYDKSKMECFNCYKMGHFAKECRGPRNQDSRNRNQDSSRRTISMEEISSKAIVAIDGAGFDWSYMADDEVPTNMALMAFSDSEVHNDKTRSKTCLKSFEALKTQLDELRIEFNKSEFNLATYKRGLASIEEQLVFYKKNEVIFYEQLVVLKRDISYKDSKLTMLKKEFQQPELEGYAPKTSKNVSEDTSNEVRNMVPRAVLMKSGLRSLNIVRLGTCPISQTLRNVIEIYYFREGRNQEGKLLMCDKKKSVLFTDTGCFVLSPNFKLVDKSQVLLKVPRKNNMYIVDMKNIVPKECLTCLVTKATLDESMLWHKRLGHVNFNTINKLVKENLMRGLPLKCFENDQTCVACLKSLLFTWVFFLATKDETSGILKSFIIEIVDKKVKIFRCDNGTEFKNKVDDDRKKDDEGVNKESRIADQEKSENSTQGVNTAGPSINIEPDMFSLGDNATLEAIHTDFFSDETEVDMSNITTTYPVPSTPNTRIHKEHSLDHVIGYVQSGVLTRRMTKTTNEQGFISEEPKKVIQALKDLSWIEAMQEELLQFKLQQIKEKVYVCKPPGFEDSVLLTGFIKVEKALYGLHQALRAWYETLSTYLLCNGFQRGQIDKTLFIKRVKSDILLVQVYVDDIIFRYTKKMLCTEFEKLMHKKFQMSSMGKLTFLLGLQVTQKDNGIFISQDKYVDEILKKFGFLTVKIASTPMETSKPLLKDAEAKDIDVHLYRSMIGSLMYLTYSRPDIMFVVCACVRVQVNPKSSHLHVVKRIFRYLKGQPKLGLWYPKDSPFDLVAYTDSGYAGASLDRKSTTGDCQFLGCRLISWQCKKHSVVANSTTKAEYIAASNCLKNPIFHLKTKHIEIRHHLIRDSNKKKLIQMIKIHTDQNVADLLTKAFDVSRFQYLITSIGMLNL
ncbi:putative ribonuclease H-like domain-containing protein [Tanacetum coccineum]